MSKLKDKPQRSATHFWFDPHLGHDAMRRFCPDTRGHFTSGDQMTEALVEAYRSVVHAGDTCIVGGDFMYRLEEKRMRKVYDALPGTKILVVGNHDGADTRALPWASQHDILYASIESTRLVICHYPMLSWMGSMKGALMLYGHHHGRIPANSQSMDCGVDVLGLAPVRLSTIKAHLAAAPPRVDPEGREFSNDIEGVPQP
jgi:calcineurin-like phosphoesterase family protein